MQSNDHLAVRLIRLKGADQWANSEGAIAFIFSKAGVGCWTSRTITHRISSGDILVLNGTANGQLSAHGQGDFLFRTFSFTVEHLFPLFESTEVSLLNKVVDTLKAGKMYAGNSALALECQKHLENVNPQFNLEHRGQLLMIATSILSAEFKNAQNDRTGFELPGNHMLQAFEKLSSTELMGLSVGELAKKFNCSRRHLNRLFHDHFGVSVASLRMEMRLLKAVSLLRDAEIKIIHVAEQCGFNHLGLFNTCFKRRFGASPGQWRKARITGKAPAMGAIDAGKGCPLQAKGFCPWVGAPTGSPRTKDAVNGFAPGDGMPPDVQKNLTRRLQA